MRLLNVEVAVIAIKPAPFLSHFEMPADDRRRIEKPFSARAHDLFRVLTGHNPDHYLEFYLAAANALAINLAYGGQPDEAARVAGKCIEHLRVLAGKFPKRFAREYAAYLISYSAARGEEGKRDEAQRTALLAVAAAKALRRILGTPDLELEGLLLRIHQERKGTKVKLEVIQNENTYIGLSEFLSKNHFDMLAVSMRKRSLFNTLFGRSLTKKMLYHTHLPIMAFHTQ